jgi:hypothetical protein
LSLVQSGNELSRRWQTLPILLPSLARPKAKGLGRASEDTMTLSASLDTAHEMSGGLKASATALPSDPDLSL